MTTRTLNRTLFPMEAALSGSSSSNKNKPYTDYEKERIISACDDAKSLGLDLQAIFIMLEEELPGRTSAAISTFYYSHKRKEKKEQDAVQTTIEDAVSATSIVQRMKSVIKERDRLKEEREVFKQQRDEYKRDFDKLKKDYDKLLSDLQEITGLI